ncbi:uncharacterized protein LOC125670603 isoform X2 [Ostrea edulis]|uniref:uncharacterized protein LOC125670603 isoform X2 n=1 Tax=Ostrea edulis TaxID=37623 RepID=UPI0024AF7239|nr:uncharacterized protein LOC125670603 isoform X2 [Ostrea edulis]
MMFQISNVWLLLHLTQQSASIRNIQQSFLHEILDKRGYVCLSSTVEQHKAESRVMCGVLLCLEEGTVIFTFDVNTLICRTYKEEDFNGCLFQACSTCKTYGYNELETTTAANAESTVSCTGLHGALLPHPTDCSKFFECVYTNAVPRVCAVSLHFDVNRNLCDYPANVDCQS